MPKTDGKGNLRIFALFVCIFAHLVGVVTNIESDEPTQISQCSKKDGRKPLTLVSTLDGKFVALDSHSGEMIWSLVDSSGPLLSSSLSSVKHDEDLAKLKFVPSLDGEIFQFQRDKIEAVPLSADLLLGRFQKLPDGTHIVGGKDIRSFGIDAETGKLIYECNMNGCQPVTKSWNLSDRDVFVLRRTQQVVRAVDQKTGQERWNFSVGSYDISYMDSPDHHTNCASYSENENLEMRFNIAHGFMEAFRPDDEKDVKWNFKFDSAIASVWKFHQSTLQPVDIFRKGILKDVNVEELPDDPFLYFGVHEGQLYAQSSKHIPPNSLPNRPDSGPQPSAESQEVAVVDQPYIGTWRPYISSSPSRTPSLMNKNGLSVWNQLDYPFDNGFCMIALKRITTLKTLNKKDVPMYNKSMRNHDDYVIPVPIVERWKEILALAIFISIFLQYTIIKLVRRRWRKYAQMVLETDETEHEIKRVRSVTTNVSTSTETPKQAEEKGFQRTPSNDEFSSRYLLDFDHLECIGKGGFGVVFKARNKIDGCDYAVKRIYLPNCDEAREKVTREVKALAKLDYPGIVRFYYSWWEEPPSGWQELTDKDRLMKNIPGGPTVGLSKEWYIHIQSDAEDTFDEDENSEESGITIKRKRNKSSMSWGSKRSSKSIGDDPLGKKINEFFDVEDELLKTDLLKNNDVFHDEKSDGDDDDDSFNIEFKNDSCSDKDNKDSDFEDNGTEDISFGIKEESEEKGKFWNDLSRSKSSQKDEGRNQNGKLLKSRMSTKLVGRCCCKSEECVRAPPLYLFIQMQLCMSNTLKDWLNENIASRQRRYIMGVFSQILNAVEYCHSQGMMHRDLKPSNIFFAMDGSIKIGDFGLVTAITRPAEGKGPGQPAIDENHTGNVGTQIYMSPEQVFGNSYNHKVDIYALGLILFELLLPFSTQMERIKSLFGVKQNSLPIGFEEKYPDEAKIIRWLLYEDPERRPEAKDFKTSELFSSICSKN